MKAKKIEIKNENVRPLMQGKVKIKGKFYILLVTPIPVSYTNLCDPIYGVIAYNKKEDKTSKEIYFNAKSLLLHPIKIRKQIIKKLSKSL